MADSVPPPVTLTPALEKAFGQLNKHERWWMERSDFFEAHGYRLRPRFRPGWVPSWQSTGQDPIQCEDARFHTVRVVMDATRLSDGRQVVLKRVLRGGNEVKISSMLSSPDALKDPLNHCVPILDYFGDPDIPGPDFMVMPLLHNFDSPEFYSVSEILDFVQQTLEGLLYIHRRGVAHRDLSDPNIMMDGTDLYPDGVHPDPLWNYLLHDHFTMARTLRRSDLKKITYYFIDFGISSYFEDPLQPRLVTGIDGIDNEVPERDLTKPYDPFAVDVFSLGNTYKRLFMKYTNLDFLSDLVEEMTDKDPKERPTAQEALALLHELTDDVERKLLSKRLRPVKEPIIVHYLHELSSSWKSFLSTMSQIFTRRNVAFVTIPVGISVLILFRGNPRIFGRIRDLFIGTRGVRR